MASKDLTETFIKSVKPMGSRKEYKDGRTQGLYLVVQPSGSKGWVWRYRRPSDDKPDKLTLGLYPAFMLTDARGWAEENNATKRRGLDPKQERANAIAAAKKEAEAQAKHDQQTLGWYWENYCLPEWIANLKDPRGELYYWRRFVQPDIGSMAITDIDHDVLALLIDEVKGYAPSTANKLVTFFKTMWKRMLSRHRHIVVNRVNAAEFLVKPAVEKHRDRTLEKREMGYLLAVLDRYTKGNQASNHRTFAFGLKLVAATGCRREEAFEASWTQFNLDEGSWLQPGGGTKNGRANLLYLTQSTVAMLRNMRALAPEDQFPFRQIGKDAPLNAFSKSQSLMWRETKALADVDGFEMKRWSTHDLRRTLSTELRGIREPGMLRPIVTDAIVEAVLNHVEAKGKTGSAKAYNYFDYVEEKAEALRIWQSYLDEAAADEHARAQVRNRASDVPRTLRAARR